MQCFNYETPNWDVLERAFGLIVFSPAHAEIQPLISDFMWMGEWKEGEHSFKHRYTRKYARLRADSTTQECTWEINNALGVVNA